jgi:hypothetical protein
MKNLFCCLISIFFANAVAQESGGKTYQFFKEQKTQIQNPFELRDPFKRPLSSTKSGRKKRLGGFVEGNSFSNLPTVDEIEVNKIKIVGVLLGKDRRALAKVEGINDTIVLKEGMKIGVDDAELKAILPGGIVLVEKIRNVYDQDEFLETIIPVTPE